MSGIGRERTTWIGRVPALLVLALAPFAPVTAQEFAWTLDVPVDLGGSSYRANQTVLRAGGGYSLLFDGTGNALGPEINIDALLSLEDGSFLFSTDTPFEAGGVWYEARDVVRHEGGDYTLQVSGAQLGLSAEANIDALGRDPSGRLLVSFDAPEEVGGTLFQRNDIAAIDNGVLVPFLSASAIRLPDDSDVVGYVHQGDGDSLFMFREPVRLGQVWYPPGDIVRHDGVDFSLYYHDPSFPAYATGAGLSLPASPGEVLDLRLGKSAADVDLTWTPGCSVDHDDYAVYEGTIGGWASHDQALCSTGGLAQATVTPENGDRYFLVVPLNSAYEGSYGTNSAGVQRSAGLTTCRTDRELHDCP